MSKADLTGGDGKKSRKPRAKGGTRQGKILPPLPEGKDKYDSFVAIDFAKRQQLPRRDQFTDDLFFWQSAEPYYAEWHSRAKRMVAKLKDLTPEERDRLRAGEKAADNAVKAVQSESVKQVAAENPDLVVGLSSNMSADTLAATIAQFQAMLQAKQQAEASEGK